MMLLQTSLIWVVYAIVVALLIIAASFLIYTYQTPRDRSNLVTLTCIAAISTLLATALLLPVDVALVSSTTSPALGRRKEWASQNEVDRIVFSLKVLYYLLYSIDALLCLIVIPFTYFWYEEYDEVAAQAGEQTLTQQFWAAAKYTISFIAISAILFLVGFFVPVSKEKANGLDFFKHLLSENRGERTLTFALGLLMTLGMCLYIFYSSIGLAFLPVSLMKTMPSASTPHSRADAATHLEFNRERQRQLEGRCGGNPEQLSSKDRRELDFLTREERTLIRRQRLADEASGHSRSRLANLCLKTKRCLRPFQLLAGIVLFLTSLTLWVSMLLTAIDKAKNSICKYHCGYILANIKIFNPINWILVQTAKVFPIDYAIFTALVLFLFYGSVVGVSVVGIRFLWIKIFQIRKGRTSPQALLLTTAMLMLIILALNYSIPMIVAPQYATFGSQTFCDLSQAASEKQPDCTNAEHLVKPCSELSQNRAAKQVCTPTVASTILNRVTMNFPFFGAILFWAQFVFLGVYVVVLTTCLLRSPKLDEQQLDEDAEEDEEESLLASTGRGFGATR